ncbi:MAG: alcohol dehydrogenase catalytic domain-containing protein [Verrucomicrobia bacterium]|nr:alcohol dehydrogenase catalytic domain-containing protein [Verrucomicrobiota bacterium]
MIAAKYTQGTGLHFGEAPMPRLADDELLVRVEATSICGTDIKIARLGHRKLQPGQSIILGHEFAGTIEQVGRRQHDYREGMVVGIAPNIGCGHCAMCGQGLMNLCPDFSAFGINFDGSHTEYVRIPAAAVAQGVVIPLPESLSPLDATLAEPLSCVVNGQRVARLAAGESVLIYGAGPMGLMHLALALFSGAAQVFMVDVNDARLAKAAELGASAVFNSLRGSVREWVAGLTAGQGVDIVVTAVPVRAVQQEAVELLAPFGRLCLFAGLPKDEGKVELDTNAIHYKNLYVTGMTGGSPQDFRVALRVMQSGRFNLKPIVSHVFPLAEVRKAYDVALSGQGLKIVMAAERWVNTGKAAASER